jgi:predicted nucleic acid-binding protein
VNDPASRDAALQILDRLIEHSIVVPAQALGELFAVLVRKRRMSPSEARSAALEWGTTYEVVDTARTTIAKAFDIVATHHLYIWDAVVLAAAAEADCRLLLSEDLQDGFTWGGVSVINPFAPSPHPLLAAALQPR